MRFWTGLRRVVFDRECNSARLRLLSKGCSGSYQNWCWCHLWSVSRASKNYVKCYPGGVWSLTSHCCIDKFLFVKVHFQSSKYVEFLNVCWLAFSFDEFVGNVWKNLSSLLVSIGLSVKLCGLKTFVFVEQFIGILMQESFNLNVPMLLSQLSGNVPVVQQNTTVHCFFIFAKFFVTFNCILGHTCQLEPIGKLIQQRIILWDFLNNLRQTIVILNHGETFNQTLVVFGSEIKLCSLVPFQPLWIIITQLIGHLVKSLIIPWTFTSHF